MLMNPLGKQLTVGKRIENDKAKAMNTEMNVKRKNPKLFRTSPNISMYFPRAGNLPICCRINAHVRKTVSCKIKLISFH